MITRESAKKADDRKRVKVMVPEWAAPEQPADEAFVWVRALSGDERDAWESYLDKWKHKGQFKEGVQIRASLVALSVVDDQGNRVFTDDDCLWLGQKSSAPLSRCFDAAVELSGLRSSDLRDLEASLKNAQSGSSG